MSKNTTWQDNSTAITREHDLFISYSRRDKDFVRQLWAKLTENNLDVWVDWEDIPPAQDWRQEIYRGIEASNHFLFIISPFSLNSVVCGEELAYAINHGKRLIPIVRDDIINQDIHPELARLNWIFFRETDTFDEALANLIATIQTDVYYVRKHTCILIRAKEWENAGYDKSFLLWGKELEQAEQWLVQSADKTPQPTALHLAYLNACRGAEEERQEAELRLRQMTPQQYRNRQALINKVRNFWIDGVLKTSVQCKTLIPLEIEERYFSIDSYNTLLSESHNLHSETTVTGIFDQLGEGRTLLILGETGAGKTTMLLELARKLIDRADSGLDDRIPVIFNLSSWGSQRLPIEVWLIEELKTKYQIPLEIGQGWVKQQQLLLLLDGLDEVSIEYRQACVDALNLFNQNHGPEIVICCRIEDYHILSRPLNFQKAIYLRSLSLSQVRSYLAMRGDELTGLRAIIETDPDLQELATSPLMLNLMALAYQGNDPSEISPSGLRQHRRRQQLLDIYIERMLDRRGADPRYSKAMVKRWLSWLARKMSQSSQTLFFIEQMQTDFLPSQKQNLHYKTINFFIVATLIFVTIFISYGRIWDLVFRGFYALTIAVIVGILILKDQDKIRLHETIQWSWKKAIKSFKRGIFYGFIGLISYGISSGVINWGLNLLLNPSNHQGLFQEFLNGLGWGFAGLLIFCPIYTIIGGLKGPEIQVKSIPNQGIWKTLLNAGLAVLIGMIVGLLMGSLIFHVLGKIGINESFDLNFGLMFGLTFGAIFGFLSGGGTPCTQHFILRLILCKNNYIPWNYAHFLDYAAERVLLRKVGGGYIFIHRFLLEHFAEMELK